VDVGVIIRLLIDALDGLERMELVPARVAGIVDPATLGNNKIAEMQLAAAVTDPRIVDIAVARTRPRSGESSRQQRQKWREQEHNLGAGGSAGSRRPPAARPPLPVRSPRKAAGPRARPAEPPGRARIEAARG